MFSIFVALAEKPASAAGTPPADPASSSEDEPDQEVHEPETQGVGADTDAASAATVGSTVAADAVADSQGAMQETTAPSQTGPAPLPQQQLAAEASAASSLPQTPGLPPMPGTPPASQPMDQQTETHRYRWTLYNSSNPAAGGNHANHVFTDPNQEWGEWGYGV